MGGFLEAGSNPMGSLAYDVQQNASPIETKEQIYTRLLGTLFNEHLEVSLTRKEAYLVPADEYDLEFEMPACWEIAVKKKGIFKRKVDGRTLEKAYYDALEESVFLRKTLS